jgi:hypothetical protein
VGVFGVRRPDQKAGAMTLQHDLAEPYEPRPAPFDRNEIELGAALWRRFSGMPDDEPTELSIFVEGRVFVAPAMTAADHVRLLREAQTLRGFEGSYVPVNGPIVDGIFYRYPRNQIIRWARKRITDKDVRLVRSIFIDFDTDDPERVSGISATDEEFHATWGPANECREWLARQIGPDPLAFGCSGNGHYVLIAIEPTPPSDETTKRIAAFLAVMNKRFGAPGVKVDGTVATPGRLMPCAGTLKAKGINTSERPHRTTTITCRPTIQRVPLGAVC